jgi:hypothetical protein
MSRISACTAPGIPASVQTPTFWRGPLCDATNGQIQPSVQDCSRVWSKLLTGLSRTLQEPLDGWEPEAARVSLGPFAQGTGPVPAPAMRTSPVKWLLVVQDDAEEAAVDGQAPGVTVIDEAEPPELVHEVTDPRPGRTHHLCQVILTDSRKHKF